MRNLMLLTFISFLLVSCEKEKVLLVSDTPAEITKYVSTHFPNNPIIQIIKDIDGLDITYDITLEGNFYLEFNRKKKIIDIEGLTKLPDSVIPLKLIEYVEANYPNNFVIGWELEDRNQQIKLDNDLELEFTMDGVFLRIEN